MADYRIAMGPNGRVNPAPTAEAVLEASTMAPCAGVCQHQADGEVVDVAVSPMLDTLEAAGNADAPGQRGVIVGLADLPASAMLTASGLAKALCVCERSVTRLVARGELPSPISMGNKKVWLVGRVLDFISKRMEQAERSQEIQAARLRNAAR